MFGRKRQLVRDAEKHDSLEIQKLGKELAKQLKLAQAYEYPHLRKKYSEFASNKLWEEDIEVKASGSGYRDLTFIGAAFAANKNKQEWQETFSDVFYKLRFKRIFYKWYSYDDGVFYELDSESDSDID